MCDIWIDVSNVHHNEVSKNFNHLEYMESKK